MSNPKAGVQISIQDPIVKVNCESMSNRVACGFAFKFAGDGTSNTVSFLIAAKPVAMILPIGDSGLIAGVLSEVPTDIYDVSAGLLGITSASINLGTLTIVFSSTVATGEYVVQGSFKF